MMMMMGLGIPRVSWGWESDFPWSGYFGVICFRDGMPPMWYTLRMEGGVQPGARLIAIMLNLV